VPQFGHDEDKTNVLASLDDVGHGITILGEAVNESVQRIEAIVGRTELIDTS
jgi:hypothetical protein